MLVTFGCASIAQSVLSLQNKGDFFSINWGSVLFSKILVLSFFLIKIISIIFNKREFLLNKLGVRVIFKTTSFIFSLKIISISSKKGDFFSMNWGSVLYFLYL